MAFPVTAIFAGLLAIWLTVLQFKVVTFRRGQKVSLGHGGDEMGERLIRAHGNAAETIPIFLILMAASESVGAPGWLLIVFGAMFLGGRVMHGVHFLKIRKGFLLRFYGMIMTLTATMAMAVSALVYGFAGL
ncbi:MAG: MAPEG family protein [Pseudomonadota bacterium]